MWKRLQGAVRDKDRHAQIGNPVLLETTYDEDQLRRNPKVTQLQNGSHQNYALPPLSQLVLQSSDPHSPLIVLQFIVSPGSSQIQSLRRTHSLLHLLTRHPLLQ
jgi:hypothetical protein